MAKAAYPFPETDVTKYLAQFKLPTFDVDSLMSSYRKNIEALTAANQCALEGVGALVRRQAEIAREAADSYSKAVGELMAEGSVEEKAARQADLARQGYDRSVANARELGDLAAKTGSEAFGFLNDRIRESFGEIQDLVVQGAARGAAAADQAFGATEQTMRRAAEQTAKAAEDTAKTAGSRSK